MMPTGTWSERVSILAKNHAVALIQGAVSGDGTCHWPSTHSRGEVAPVLGMVAIRMREAHSPAVEISSLEFFTGQFQKPLRGISMLLCPLANHTSPINISSSFWTSPMLSLMVRVWAVNEAAGVLTVNSHVLSDAALAVAAADIQSPLTLMVAPGVAFPQRRTSVCC